MVHIAFRTDTLTTLPPYVARLTFKLGGRTLDAGAVIAQLISSSS